MQHTDSIHPGKPEVLVGIHHQPQRYTARSGNAKGEEMACSHIEVGEHVISQNGHTDIAGRRYKETIECPTLISPNETVYAVNVPVPGA